MRVLLTIFLSAIRSSHGKGKNDFDVSIKGQGRYSADMTDVVVNTA